jgi:AcrR family transcriptional regulator
MKQSSDSCRKTRILDAAELAFADFGFAGASLRQIVRAAKVNLATVYYYFQSKEGLMKAVLDRRFGQLKREHLDLLKEFGRQAGNQPLPIEKILEAMLLPPLRLAVTASVKNPVVMRLIGRIVSEPDPKVQKLLHNRHAEVRAAFIEVLQRSFPRAPLPDLLWRLEFVWGALAFVLCNQKNIQEKTRGMCDPLATREILAQMTAFFAAGFRAAALTKKN